MDHPRRVLLLASAGSRRGARALREAEALLREAGADVHAHLCAKGEPVDEAARDRAPGRDAIVLAGGDGTISRAANAVIASGLPLGVVPAGTANDLARTLGIPTDVPGAVRVILDGRTAPVDVGDVNGHGFFNVASIGLSGDLARALSPGAKRRFGRLAYAEAALRTLLTARPFRARIVRDGPGASEPVRVRTYQIAVGNGVLYGGGNVVAEDAAIDDASLDLYSLEMRGVWKLVFMLRAFRSGTHGTWREVRTDRGTGFEVRTARPRSVNADGEIVTRTPARFSVRPAALRVFVPADR